MKENAKRLKKRIAILAVIGTLLTTACFATTVAEDVANSPMPRSRYIVNFNIRVNGVDGEEVYGTYKQHDNTTADGSRYVVNLDSYTDWNPGYNVVMNHYMVNTDGANRGFGQTLQGTRNEIPNMGVAGKFYSLVCTRQYMTDDVYVTFKGSWSPDKA